jgi:butyrate kinase
MKILVINPGSTSTKISLFEDDTLLFEESAFHDAPVLLQYPSVNDQVPFRKKVVLDILKHNGYTPEDIDLFVGRGGSAHSHGRRHADRRPPHRDTLNAAGGSEHAAKLGVLLAYDFCKEYGGKMFTLNPLMWMSFAIMPA